MRSKGRRQLCSASSLPTQRRNARAAVTSRYCARHFHHAYTCARGAVCAVCALWPQQRSRLARRGGVSRRLRCAARAHGTPYNAAPSRAVFMVFFNSFVSAATPPLTRVSALLVHTQTGPRASASVKKPSPRGSAPCRCRRPTAGSARHYVCNGRVHGQQSSTPRPPLFHAASQHNPTAPTSAL